MQPRISMITLGVRDLARAVEFYEKGLGFPRMDSPPEVAFFTLNGTWLALWGREDMAVDVGTTPDGHGIPGFTLAHSVRTEEEVDAVVEQAVAAGAKLVKQPRKVFWSGNCGYFSDRDGYIWEVAYNPHFRIGPADDSGEPA